MKQYAVIGCGRFGTSLAKTLYQLGNDVLAIDGDEEIVQSISKFVTHAVQADVTDEEVMKELGIGNFDVAIVSIGTDIQSSILATIIVKELGVEQVIAKANDELHSKALQKIGADKVVMPEKDMGDRLAYNLNSSNVNMLDYITISDDYKIVQITPSDSWVGQKIGNLDLRKNYGISVITIEDRNGKITMPNADTIIGEKDLLLILCSNEDLNAFLGNKHLL